MPDLAAIAPLCLRRLEPSRPAARRALDGQTGTEKWGFTTGNFVASSPAIGADGTIYVGSNDFNMYAFNGQPGAKKWASTTEGKVYSSPAIGADGTVCVGSGDGNVYAIGP